ncbi:MAG: hypothetical protein JJLCMIEE_01887 [Acidimicrobiales bacterium]|nr:hypothetical protein [Acidimicrobiales bacterium]
MRAPGAGPARRRELYATALDMAEWAENHNGLSVVVSEHHAADDGFLPSPLVLASAMAARTASIPVMVGALLIPLYDPVKLAEDMAVLDIISDGRVSYIAGLGYRPSEYEMFGQDFHRRGKRMDHCLSLLQQAWTGEPFQVDGRTVRVTPSPQTPAGPKLFYGGGTPAAARRAARFGLDLFAEVNDPGIEVAFRQESERLGRQPGRCIIPPRGSPNAVFVATDPDAAWARLGEHLLLDARSYAAWLGTRGTASSSTAGSVEELRAENGNYRILTPAQAVETIKSFGYLSMQPLCGGIAPDIAWESLELLATEVLPALTG